MTRDDEGQRGAIWDGACGGERRGLAEWSLAAGAATERAWRDLPAEVHAYVAVERAPVANKI